MKKLLLFLLVLILLIAGGLGGGMYWFGNQLEGNYQQAMKQVTQQSGLVTRGSGFSSSFMMSTASSLTLVPGFNITFNGNHNIAPGPLTLGMTDALMGSLMSGDVMGALVKYQAMSSVKPMGKKGLPPDGRKLLARMPAIEVTTVAGLLSDTVTVQIKAPAFKGVWRGTDVSWNEMNATFEGDSDFGNLHLTGGSATLRLPADIVEELVRLRIHLDIENLKSTRKLKPQEIKKLSPAAADLAVRMALPDYLKRYGILEVLSNARNAGVPLTVSMQPGRVKVGGVTLPK